MNSIGHILERIDRLTFPELVLEIEHLGLQNISCFPIGNKQKIYRARPTEKIDFQHTDQLSYNPWPKHIDRASTPCSPIFYGTISANPTDYPMLTNFSEINQILRNNSFDYDEQKVAIAEFETIKDFPSAGIIFCKKFLDKNSQYRKLYNEAKKSSMSDFEILEDFSDLFSYTENDKYYDNRLTSAFTYYLFDKYSKIEAILYPSARLKGEGTNIAIHPITVKTKLKCKRVVVKKIYMREGFVISDYISKADSINSDGSFKLVEIEDSDYHIGKELCINKLDELIKLNKLKK